MAEHDAESQEETEARCFLKERLGLTVSRVPSTTRKTPDFLVDGDGHGYVVEVKTRLDDEEYLQTLAAGHVAVNVRVQGHDRWGVDNARNALKQFLEVDRQHQRFWVLWFAVKCEAGADAMFSQAIGTLFGAKQIVCFDEESDAARMHECLYVVPGIFERWPDIDGAFVTRGAAITLCVNEFSERVGGFESSGMYRAFAQRGGPNTAALLEKRGFLSIRDRTIDRRDENAVCEHLSAKYRLRNVHVLNMKTGTAAVLLRSPVGGTDE